MPYRWRPSRSIDDKRLEERSKLNEVVREKTCFSLGDGELGRLRPHHHNRPSACLRLEDRHPGAIERVWIHVDVAGGVEPDHLVVLDCSGHANAFAEIEFVNGSLDMHATGAVSDEDQQGVRAHRYKGSEQLEEHLGLEPVGGQLRQAGRPEDHGAARRQPETSASVGLRRHLGRQRHGAWDDRDTIGRDSATSEPLRGDRTVGNHSTCRPEVE